MAKMDSLTYLKLRGENHSKRNFWDVKEYDLYFTNIDVVKQSIQGIITTKFEYLKNTGVGDTVQIDLKNQFKVISLTIDGQKMSYKKDSDFIFIPLTSNYNLGASSILEIQYSGIPQVAKRAPWDGGFVWSTDSNHNPRVAVACEGDGASIWWPCKDYLGDKPDKVNIKIIGTEAVTPVSNGKLLEKEPLYSHLKEYIYQVSYPINLYNITLNMGNYVRWKDSIQINGHLFHYTLNFYENDIKKAKIYFRPRIKRMFEAYEHYLGPYPFPKDGYILTQAPYWGMEHQSCVAYGNHFKDSTKGFEMDFILIHESGHEYFGNALSVSDHAEMWLHEGFTTYLESLYLKFNYGDSAYLNYINQQRRLILNKKPILGHSGLYESKSSDNDEYYKGAWLLHTLKSMTNNDSLFFKMLKSWYNINIFKQVTTSEFVTFSSKVLNKDYTAFFDNYLKSTQIPKIEIKIKGTKSHSKIRIRMAKGFKNPNMRFWLNCSAGSYKIVPTDKWQRFKILSNKMEIGHLLMDWQKYYLVDVELK